MRKARTVRPAERCNVTSQQRAETSPVPLRTLGLQHYPMRHSHAAIKGSTRQPAQQANSTSNDNHRKDQVAGEVKSIEREEQNCTACEATGNFVVFPGREERRGGRRWGAGGAIFQPTVRQVPPGRRGVAYQPTTGRQTLGHQGTASSPMAG